MSDATGLAEALLGLDGFRVLAVDETAAEVVIRVETTGGLVGCPGCGVQATPHDRMAVELRDLPVFGRPARLVWCKRRWRCRESLCEVRTWTETSPGVLVAVCVDASGRMGGVQAGRPQRPPGHAAGR